MGKGQGGQMLCLIVESKIGSASGRLLMRVDKVSRTINSPLREREVDPKKGKEYRGMGIWGHIRGV